AIKSLHSYLCRLVICGASGIDCAMRRRLVWGMVLAAMLVLPVGGRARDVLGVFQGWGAFRDSAQARCFAISRPLVGGWEASPWRPFAAVGYWPKRDVRGQLHIRLSHQ